MIAYEVLVQTIADWKAGVRPTAPTPPPRAPIGTPAQVEEFSSGVVDLDDESFATEEYEEGGYEQGEYDESAYQQPAQTYDDDDES